MTIYHWPYNLVIGDPPPPDIGTYHTQPIPQGWQCPVCKTVYAPSVFECRCDQRVPTPRIPTEDRIRASLDHIRCIIRDGGKPTWEHYNETRPAAALNSGTLRDHFRGRPWSTIIQIAIHGSKEADNE